MYSHALLATALAILPQISHASYFCYNYFGSINATVDLHEVTPEHNYDNSTACPKTWSFPSESGAMLSICPSTMSGLHVDFPLDMTLDVRLLYNPYHAQSPRGIKANLRDIYVTNGSHSTPHRETGAVPVGVKLESEDANNGDGPKFSIKGDQTALLPYQDPYEAAPYRWNTLDCEEYHETVAYCAETLWSGRDFECWNLQSFIITPETDFNFTISFSGARAVVEMSFTGEGEHEKNMTLWLSAAVNTVSSDYYLYPDIALEVDENEILMLRNTSDWTGRAYFAANGTYSDDYWADRLPSGASMSVVDMEWLGVVVLVAVGQMLM